MVLLLALSTALQVYRRQLYAGVVEEWFPEWGFRFRPQYRPIFTFLVQVLVSRYEGAREHTGSG